MSSYCDEAPGHEFHGPYHDTEYGFPITDENALLERLALEIFQAGLSWLLVLKKRAETVKAFDGFDVDKVAAYGDAERERLLANPGIIRNKLKINAIIENARRIQAMRDSHGGFANWIEAQHPMHKADWTRLFKKTFKFTGGEIVNEFLMSIGYLPGAHREDCPVFAKIAAHHPAWMQVDPTIFEGEGEGKAK